MSAQTVRLNHYTQGPPDGPAVLLGGSLGTSLPMWDSLADALSADHHVVRLDLRGHGSSPAPAGPYTMGELAADVVAVADELELDRFAYVGLSLGGAVGLTLALEHPDRLTSLVLAGSAATFGDPTDWRARAARVTAEGTGWLVELQAERWFTADFRDREPATVADILEMVAETSPVGYAGCCEALAGFDVGGRLAEVAVPTRVVVGAEDPVTPPEAARALAAAIPGADLVLVDRAAHLVNVVRPAEFNAAVREHLTGRRSDPVV